MKWRSIAHPRWGAVEVSPLGKRWTMTGVNRFLITPGYAPAGAMITPGRRQPRPGGAFAMSCMGVLQGPLNWILASEVHLKPGGCLSGGKAAPGPGRLVLGNRESRGYKRGLGFLSKPTSPYSHEIAAKAP